MSKQIRTYEDLLRQKLETEILLQAQKELLVSDLRLLQAEFKSTTSSLSFIGKLVKGNKKNFLINMGVNKVLDFLLKKVVLARAGWMTRLAVTYFAKNLSSNIIEAKKDQLMEKLFHWVSHKNGNGRAHTENYDQA